MACQTLQHLLWCFCSPSQKLSALQGWGEFCLRRVPAHRADLSHVALGAMQGVSDKLGTSCSLEGGENLTCPRHCAPSPAMPGRVPHPEKNNVKIKYISASVTNELSRRNGVILNAEKYLPLECLKKSAVIKRKYHKRNAKQPGWALTNTWAVFKFASLNLSNVFLDFFFFGLWPFRGGKNNVNAKRSWTKSKLCVLSMRIRRCVSCKLLQSQSTVFPWWQRDLTAAQCRGLTDSTHSTFASHNATV